MAKADDPNFKVTFITSAVSAEALMGHASRQRGPSSF